METITSRHYHYSKSWDQLRFHAHYESMWFSSKLDHRIPKSTQVEEFISTLGDAREKRHCIFQLFNISTVFRFFKSSVISVIIHMTIITTVHWWIKNFIFCLFILGLWTVWHIVSFNSLYYMSWMFQLTKLVGTGIWSQCNEIDGKESKTLLKLWE